jgi:hypothetical protein
MVYQPLHQKDETDKINYVFFVGMLVYFLPVNFENEGVKSKEIGLLTPSHKLFWKGSCYTSVPGIPSTYLFTHAIDTLIVPAYFGSTFCICHLFFLAEI